MSDVDISVGNHPVQISPLLMIVGNTVSGLVVQETIEKMEKDLKEAIDDFGRVTNVDSLRRIKETGEQLFLAMLPSFSTALFRGGTFVSTAQTCQHGLSPEFWLYAWHPRIPP